MPGSCELRALYRDPAAAGVPWLLDPEVPQVQGALRAAAHRTAEDACDLPALVADLPDLLVLLRARHFGLATGVVAAGGLDGWAEAWRDRLSAEQPSTWGAALGTAFHDLRWLVGDRHLHAAGEDRHQLRAVDPRRHEPVLGNHPSAGGAGGEPVSELVINGVLAVRIGSFAHTGAGDRALARWRDAHHRHFGYDRIVVDLRGNGGGGDRYARDWIAGHVPEPVDFVPGRSWRLDGRPLIWNQLVQLEAVRGSAAIPDYLHRICPEPRPGSALTIEAELWRVLAGPEPWHGRMLVLIDRETASAGEGVAWLLRLAFGARLAGGRSLGAVSFGDIAPYLLPRSGLQVWLATRWDGFPEVELVGLPLDVALDPRTPLAEVAAEFDRTYGA
jgi:hypothetical protein